MLVSVLDTDLYGVCIDCVATDEESEEDSSLEADSDSSTDTDDASEGQAMDTSSPKGANCMSPGHDG